MLNDENTYMKIFKDPINMINLKLKDMLSRWKKLKYISDDFYKKLYVNGGNISRAYALPKKIVLIEL